MQCNNYDGVMPPQTVRLIEERARRLKFPPDQIGDLQQRIVPHLLAFRFDPQRSNGASRRTALVALIDRQLRAVARAEDRYRRRVERARQQMLDAAGDASEPAAAAPPVDLVLDVREAVARLSPTEQSICRAMGEGRSAARIAEQLGLTRKRVRILIGRIRSHFKTLGLEAWITGEGAQKGVHHA